jgi:nucleoid DNA-binding protein
MNKALLILLSGGLIVSTSSKAETQSDMESYVSAQTGQTTKQAHNALQAFELQMKEEIAARREVKLDDFGSYRPREKKGTRQAFGKTIDNWALIKKPEVVNEELFNARAAAKAGMSVDDFDKHLEAYKKGITTRLTPTNSILINGDGHYEMKRTYKKEGRKTVEVRTFNYKAYGPDNQHEFTPTRKTKCTMKARGC